MKKLLFSLFIMLCITQAYAQTTYNVSANGANSGTSWTTIKAAITAAASGDIIQVAAGTFTEKNITLNAVKSLTIKGLVWDSPPFKPLLYPIQHPLLQVRFLIWMERTMLLELSSPCKT